jgi:hypothetical protein
MCKTWAFVGSERGADTLTKFRGLASNDNKVILDGLYGVLSVLDTKAAGLLSVNALFLVVLTAVLGFTYASPHEFVMPPIYARGAWMDVSVLVLSSVLCLFVVQVSWKFLGLVKENDFTTELKSLSNAIDDRTWLVRSASYLTLYSLISPIVWYLIETMRA